MSTIDSEWVVAVMSNMIVLIIAGIGASWKISGMKGDILSTIAGHSREDTDEFSSIRDEIDSMGRTIGESIAAVRQKINEVELATAQTYVRRDGFYKAMEEIKDNIAIMRREIREDLQRMESKLPAS